MVTTDDGNTSRRFFADAHLCGDTTGVDEELIGRFATILNTINCNKEINVTKFRDFAIATARLFAGKNWWYPMPNAVHKILIQGSQIIQDACLPIGMLSEEALKASNKVYRLQRQFMCRTATNEDVMPMDFRKIFPEEKLKE